MEDLLEDNSFPSLLTCISNSSKFKLLCKTIYNLRSRYLLRGYKQDKITQKIMCKIFNTRNPSTVNWLNLKNTVEYHKIKNLVELDPKTIELALAIQQEMEKMKKRKKQDKHSKDYTLDEMLDLFQCRLETDPIFEKNSSSSSSESPSDNGDNHMSPEQPGLSYYDQSKHFEGMNVYKDKSNIGKRKSRLSVPRDEDDMIGEYQIKEELVKRLKVPYKAMESIEVKRSSNLGQFKNDDIFFEICKRGRDNDGNKAIAEKFKCFKL